MKNIDDSEFTQLRFKKNYIGYKSWNSTSAECFLNKCNCSICSNSKYCNSLEWHKNPYNIANIKYAVLMTYANIGDKGIDRYCTKLAQN